MDIENSFQLEYVAYYSMHLENMYIEMTGSKDTRQRDRYTQFIEMINQAPFDVAYQKFLQISLTDTDIEIFSEAQLLEARHLASMDLGLPLPELPVRHQE